MMKIGSIHTGYIEKIAFGGKGLLRVENFVVLLKGGIPGQKVRFQITRKKKNYGEGKILEVLERSSREIISPYEKMPGCHFQNLAYEEQLHIKSEQVKEAVEHIAGIFENPDVFLPIIPSPEQIRYRNKAEFSFGYQEMNVEINEQGEKIFHDLSPALGFHPEGKWNLVKPIEDCLLLSEKTNQVRKAAEEICLQTGLPVWNPKIHSGFWRTLIVRESRTNENIIITFVVSESKSQEFWKSLEQALCAAVPEIIGIMYTIHTGKSDALIDPSSFSIYGEEYIEECLGDVKYRISPFSFFQTNTKGAEKLFTVVAEFADLQGTENVLDLFCGSGAIGLFLAEKAKKIIGIELNAQAVADARENASRNGITNAEYFCGKAEKILPEVLSKNTEWDVIILDPPRSGLHPKALKLVAETPARRIVFVSCNPATLARDIQSLCEAGWKIVKVQPVDMFPQTPHIEVVVELERNVK